MQGKSDFAFALASADDDGLIQLDYRMQQYREVYGETPRRTLEAG